MRRSTGRQERGKLLPSTVLRPTTRQLVAVGLVALAGLWLLFNEPFEGATLVVKAE